MVYTSRTTIYIPSVSEQKQYKVLKPKKEVEALPPDSTDVYADGLHRKYMRRLDDELFNNMSLVKHATTFKFFGKNQYSTVSKSRLETYCLTGSPEMYIRERTKAACFRTYMPEFCKDKEAHCYSMLCLFLPWRCPQSIIHPFQTAVDASKAKQHLLDKTSLQQYKYSDKLLHSLKQIQSLSDMTRPEWLPGLE